MSIGLLYEQSETDEMGIKLTAEELGVNLTFIPFRKIAISIYKNGYNVATRGKNYNSIIKDVAVVLNRAQSKNRRLYASHIMEALGKKVINSFSIEFECYSKFRTLTHLWAVGLPIPKTVYVPCDAFDITKDGRVIRNESDIADLLQKEIGDEIVTKPDAGTHGKAIGLSRSREELIANVKETKPSIINPIGILAQEFIEKWFYDLRIIVYKEKGKDPICHPVAMARAGLKDFRTNTSLGNFVFDAKLPQRIREQAVKCGKVIAREHEAWVFGLDAMINAGKYKNVDNEVKAELAKAAVEFEKVEKMKHDETRLRDFKAWNSKLETAVKNYKSIESYSKVKDIIEENVEANQLCIVFHEANSCPDFWENTRLITGINLAVPLLKGAESLIQS